MGASVYLAEDIRRMDQQMLESGRCVTELVERAGEAIWQALQQAGDVWVFAGPGNNGADGLAAAKRFAQTRRVAVFLLGTKRAPVNEQMITRLQEMGVPVLRIEREGQMQQYVEDHPAPALVLDALLGVSGNRPPEGLMAQAVRTVNALSAQARVVAIDVPTGVHSDTGRMAQAVVRADETLSMMGYKAGLLLEPGRSQAGPVRVLYPFESAYRPARRRWHIGWDDMPDFTRPRYSHKGSYGCLGLIAGSHGYSGAGYMSAMSALRSGCGTLVILSPERTAQVYRIRIPQAMTIGLPDDTANREMGAYEIYKQGLDALAARAGALAVGPGMGRGGGVLRLLEDVLTLGVPTVLDADALNALADGHTGLLNRTAGPVIVTPHPAEMGRLIGMRTDQVLQDPIACAENFAGEHGCICVLKLASTIIAGQDRTAIVDAGDAGMAKGGSGDVLTGCIGALLAQGYPAFEAAYCGAFICGKAGELAALRRSSTSMLPTDTIDALCEVFLRLERG